MWASNISVGANTTRKVPTLYDLAGEYVVPVNSFLNELVDDHIDLVKISRGLLFYWSYLEKNGLFWENFLQEDTTLNPLYGWPHMLGRASSNGDIDDSTAMTYLEIVINFYEYTAKNMILGGKHVD